MFSEFESYVNNADFKRTQTKDYFAAIYTENYNDASFLGTLCFELSRNKGKNKTPKVGLNVIVFPYSHKEKLLWPK